jgi:hypothetical protein
MLPSFVSAGNRLALPAAIPSWGRREEPSQRILILTVYRRLLRRVRGADHAG